MAKCGLRTKKLWHDIKIIIVKTVLAMLPELMINYEHEFSGVVGPQCFQIIGFDIIVRENGTPILLEVNAAPSLTIDHSLANGTRMKSIVDEFEKNLYAAEARSTSQRPIKIMRTNLASQRRFKNTMSPTAHARHADSTSSAVNVPSFISKHARTAMDERERLSCDDARKELNGWASAPRRARLVSKTGQTLLTSVELPGRFRTTYSSTVVDVKKDLVDGKNSPQFRTNFRDCHWELFASWKY
ncbi:hypothetical protein TELCIR_04064 [Teladorsagia circumcincta]|uniref:Tubulin-tyrosine ligase family protein n=1 Tax=Teladorsagia circumcincta TaxID=45464 RepID=A0A2G9UUP0_TELCI|nr:hypothetical protein TELCIR_04064 [Teladorsagia circumcincta]